MARPTGIPNKNKSFLLKRLQTMYGDDFHPIIKMAENAVKLNEVANLSGEGADIKAAIDGWDKIAAYTEPKLKAMELTGANGGDIALSHSVFEFVPVGNDKTQD